MLSTFSRLKLIELKSDKGENRLVYSFKKQDLKKYLKDISKESNQKSLRNISRALYFSFINYRRLINYYATLFNFDFIVEPYGILPDDVDSSEFKKDYKETIDFVESLNIKTEFKKILFHTYLDGVFYGYLRNDNGNYYIQYIDPDYCRVSFINPNTGQLGYSFDFSYFSKKEDLLSSFPEEFERIYKKIKRKGGANSWEKIDSPYAICIKPPVSIYPIPPFVGLFESILDIADFKSLEKSREEIQNYMLLFQKIPMKTGDKAEVNQFLIDEQFVRIFHNNIEANLPDQIGLITSPMEVTAIKLEKDQVDKNKVGQATTQFWKESGVSELLFGANDTSQALKYSVIADESDAFFIVQNIERWINEFMKIAHKNSFKFRVKILETTKFNAKEFIETRLKAAQFGMPVKNEIVAAMGHQPSAIYLNAFLENEVLKLNEKLIPLKSSHVQTANEGGRPPKDDEELTESGAKTRENETNEGKENL